VTGNVVAVAFG